MKVTKNLTTKKLLTFAVGLMLLLATVFGILFGTHRNAHAEDDRDPITITRSCLYHHVGVGETDAEIERTVTDAGIENNPIDVFDCKSQFKNIGANYIDKGFDYVTVTLEFYMREIYGGYQHIYLYSHGKKLDEVKLNYYGSDKIDKYHYVIIDFKTQYLLGFLDNYFDMDITIRYDASGVGKDTWKYKEMLIRVQASQVSLRSETTKYGNV